ncbi:hypothetical protein ACVMFA_007342 [Bradyrhizobium liaoningense]
MRIRLSVRQATPHDDGRIGERHSRAPRKLSASPADAITTPDCRIVMTPAFCGFGKTLTQKQTGISEAIRTRPAHLAYAVGMVSAASPVAGTGMTPHKRAAPAVR